MTPPTGPAAARPPGTPVGPANVGSLRRILLLGIGAPVLVFMLINAVTLYRQALTAADTAYDRTLLASAKAIGELLSVSSVDGRPRLSASLTYSALEAFEADNRSRMVYKVSGFDGEMVTGFENLRTWSGSLPERNIYAALVHFYDDSFEGQPVRVAVLLQPVAGDVGQGMATIQVAETLELRHALARDLLVQTVWQQGLLLLVVGGVLAFAVQRATEPVQRLSRQLQGRAENDLSPLPDTDAPEELRPVVEATNDLMARLSRLLTHQKRFVRDTSHQLRTPLAVLQTQVQSALRGDVEPQQALREIGETVTAATTLANQMLALAKVEQLRQEGAAGPTDWAPIVQQVSLELAPLIADQQLDFDLQVGSATVQAHGWALRELARNLLHNAIRYSPTGAPLLARLRATDDGHVELLVRDHGCGLDAQVRERLFQPFVQGAHARPGGTGLGLAICGEIVQTLGGRIVLDNRVANGVTVGLDACVTLPAPPASVRDGAPSERPVLVAPGSAAPAAPRLADPGYPSRPTL